MNNIFNLELKTDRIAEASYEGALSPFLTIITRTQGRRPHTLVEVLTCLAAQSDTDFEVLLLGHRLDADEHDLVLGMVDDCPKWLRSRIRFIAVEHGTRTRPLQLGFAAARGAYVAMLDDDDIVFAHWVERFRDLSRLEPGRVLRGNTVLQIVDTVVVQGVVGLRAEAAPELRYPRTFNFFEHILENHSPPMTLAFPRQRIAFEGIRFDETLTTTEDWDFFMRCAAVAGVANGAGITSVYRWWNKGESSRTVHRKSEWQENHYRIWKNWDAACFRLPPGGMRELVNILQEHAAFGAELRRQQLQGAKLELDPALLNRDPEQRLAVAKLKVHKILSSTCWRLTAPLRRIGHLVSGGREIDAAWLQCATAEQAEALVCQLYQSRSWRIAGPVRVLKRLLDRFRDARMAMQ
jgi:glycosyltransferase involved in cell wall biosynthesis